MKPITVSFKLKEQWLYDYIVDQSSSPSTYLKDLAIADYKNNGNKNISRKEEVKNIPKFDFLD